MSLGWWLFVRKRSSIVVEVADPLLLIVRGPKSKLAFHRFAAEDDLVEKAVELETELIRDGWVPLGYNHERRSPAE
jgi:hypothetical protein